MKFIDHFVVYLFTIVTYSLDLDIKYNIRDQMRNVFNKTFKIMLFYMKKL